jgi:transcriptional regulator with XRE-family HTH domain
MKLLRETRNMTQQQLADLAGLPRATWASLESGTGNPTLAVLTRLASALQVSIEELIAPAREQMEFFPAGFAKPRKKSGGSITPLIPESIRGMDIERIELEPGGVFNGTPHTRGTREYLSCESGIIELVAAGHIRKLGKGDALVFRGDQRHTYRNPDKTRCCVAISIVCIPS